MLNISLTDQVQAFVEEQATAAGFNSANEHVYHLILREQERIESLLLERLESEEPVEAMDDW